VDKRDPAKQIIFDFRSLGEDDDLIRTNSERYCLKQVYKFCYYISKLHQIEILRMKCEFARDFHGSIWFQFASEIYVRPNLDAKKDLEEEIARINKINKAHKEKLVNEMEEHQVVEEGTRQQVDKIQGIMEDHYQRMRKKAGIEEILDNSDGSDQETEEVFRKLYPDSKHKLMDILTCKVKEPVKRVKSQSKLTTAVNTKRLLSSTSRLQYSIEEI
jgi:hypothetical protein